MKHLPSDLEKHASSVLCRWCGAVLIGLTFVVFWQVNHFEFINFDDPFIVSSNPHIRGGLTWSGIRWAFSADFFENSSHADYWQPVTFLSRMFDVEFFGLDPGMHHLMNAGYHLANTLVLFSILHSMTGWIGRSMFVAACFAVHPLHVESVAWIVERKDTLSGLFLLLTIRAYLQYAAAPRLDRYMRVIVFFVIGLMSKPMGMTLPFALLLLDYWPLNRWPMDNAQKAVDHGLWTMRRSTRRRLILEKVPLLALSAVSITIALGTISHSLRHASLATGLSNVLLSYVQYLWKMIVPLHLAIFYPRSLDPPSAGWMLINGALLAGISAWAICAGRRRPYFFVGWFWFVGMLLPVAGLYDIVMADRFTYLPSIGFFVMLAWGATELLAGWRWRCITLRVGAGILILLFAAMSWVQTRYWRNSITLFEHALCVNPGNVKARCFLAFALKQAGKPGPALEHYAKVLAIAPDHEEARNNMANLLLEQGKVEEAIEQWKIVLNQEPGYADAHYNLARALGKIGKTSEALHHDALAIRLDPLHSDAHHNMGTLLIEMGRVEDGIRHYQAALEIDPNLSNTHYNIGALFLSRGKPTEAIRHLQQAVRSDPDFAEAHECLGKAFDAVGRSREAVVCFRRSLELKPDLAESHNNLAAILLQRGWVEEAVFHLVKAVQLKPDLVEAHCNLGQVTLQQGLFDEAMQHYRQAVTLKPDWPQGHFFFAAALERAERAADAAAEYRKVLQLQSDSPEVAMRLAWILATHDTPPLCNPPEALSLARDGCRGLDENHPRAKDTLAAALAANGRFPEAARVAAEAAKNATTQGLDELAREINGRAALYRVGRPFGQDSNVHPSRGR